VKPVSGLLITQKLWGEVSIMAELMLLDMLIGMY